VNLKTRLRSIAAIAAAISLTISSTGHAGKPHPVVAIDNLQNGSAVFNNVFQLSGTAQDADGISTLVGNIRNVASNMYYGPDGKRSNKVIPVPFQFTPNAQRIRWATQQFPLPPGQYVFRFRAQDTSGLYSKLVKVPFTMQAGGTSTPAVTATAPAPAAASNKAPRIAVQFPKNGAVMQNVVVFRGIAKDDNNITAVVATVMDANSGLFLNPNGKFGKSAQLRLRTSSKLNPQWASPEISLPPGKYLFSAKAIDAGGAESAWSQTSFTVAGQPARAATAPAATASAPHNTAPARVASGRVAANGMNFCSNAGRDADGDGFGWENNASCVVAGSKADTHPTCASSASDPDGDGYGWENERSCIVVTHCGSASSDPDGDGFGWENGRSCVVLPAAANGRFLACASRDSDPDGDGYGWENNKTCLVQ